MRFNSTSFEFPLLLGVKAIHHEKRAVYDMYVQGGGSYEVYYFDGISAGGGATGSAGIELSQNSTSLSTRRDPKQWFNAILGFKINTVIRQLGAVEYGLSYHLPFGYAGPYHVEVMAHNQGGSYTYKGDFQPRLSYIDLKLCYYFLNLGKDFTRKRYNKV